jgi:hypothetical protein
LSVTSFCTSSFFPGQWAVLCIDDHNWKVASLKGSLSICADFGLQHNVLLKESPGCLAFLPMPPETVLSKTVNYREAIELNAAAQCFRSWFSQ